MDPNPDSDHITDNLDILDISLDIFGLMLNLFVEFD